MSRKKLPALCMLAAAGFAAPTAAVATPCQGVASCTVGGILFTETGGTRGDGLTFLASFPTDNQSNSTIATDVELFLGADGYSGITYLGRQDGSGTIDGDGITVTSTDGFLTGKWTFDPGTTGDIAEFLAIHAGNGQTDEELFLINDPGLSGTWGTLNGKTLSNFDLFGGPAAPVPEPFTLSLFGAGLVAGAAALRRRKKATD
jgi:hypothetical protein